MQYVVVRFVDIVCIFDHHCLNGDEVKHILTSWTYLYIYIVNLQIKLH